MDDDDLLDAMYGDSGGSTSKVKATPSLMQPAGRSRPDSPTTDSAAPSTQNDGRLPPVQHKGTHFGGDDDFDDIPELGDASVGSASPTPTSHGSNASPNKFAQPRTTENMDLLAGFAHVEAAEPAGTRSCRAVGEDLVSFPVVQRADAPRQRTISSNASDHGPVQQEVKGMDAAVNGHGGGHAVGNVSARGACGQGLCVHLCFMCGRRRLATCLHRKSNHTHMRHCLRLPSSSKLNQQACAPSRSMDWMR